MNAANVDVGNLMLRLNAQAMEIIRLRQLVDERDAEKAAQAERLESLVAGKAEEGVATDYCESCDTSFIKGYGNHRPVVWFQEAVVIPGQGSPCYSACASCVSKHGLEGHAV
jgi:hypothetical protein